MNHRFWPLLIALLLALVPSSHGQLFGDKSHLTPTLLADTSAVVPGKPFTVGVLLEMDPGWHTYWQFPGDSGGKPRITWQLPEGFKAGEIQWPTPKAHMDEGDMLTYIYEDKVMLLVQITPPAQINSQQVQLAGQVNWLVCEKTCIPGEGPISLSLPVSTEANPANTQVFGEWRANLPKSATPPFKADWDVSKPDAIVIKLSGLPADAKVEFFPLPPEGASVEHPKVAKADQDGSHTITLPYSAENPLTQPWAGVVAVQSGAAKRESWLLNGPAAGTPAAAVSRSAPETAPTAPPQAPTTSGPQKGLLTMLGIAFLGGLILNVMPCVLPVIALKIFGFMQQAHESRQRIFRLGLAFVAGVFVFFLGLATLAVILGQSFVWGSQFQNPFILAGLIALVFVFALNMLGVFEVTLGSATTSKLSELSSKEGYSGAFLHGLFTTLLGTSCTAPFLAPSLGYAVTQPAPIVYLLFITVAVGMSLPYFLLTANPKWLRFVPKPGMWMERVKQVLGFVVLAVAVWLLTVLTRDHGEAASAAVTWYLLLLGVGAWLLGVLAHRRGASLVLLAVAVIGWFAVVQQPLHESRETPTTSAPLAEKDGIPWQPWSEEAVSQGRQAGQAVFVDFTANWCINCKFFEKTVLETDVIRAVFRDKGVLALKADWTKADPKITAALRSFGRVGVPLYVLYRPGESEPIVMDSLTKDRLLEHLAPIGRTPAAVAAMER